MLSIPETYSENLCVVKQGRPGKEDLLINILGHNKLPLTVCFPRNRTITLGDKIISSNRIPHLNLTETFDEVYLLGNYINNGEICKDVIQVPLYISQLRVSVVNGLNGGRVQKWKQYKRDVNDQCSMIKYDQEVGNPGIAEYDPRAVHSGKALSYLEPMTYENIVNLVQTNDPQSFYPDMTPEEIDELGLYEDVPLSDSTRQNPELYYNQPENNKLFKKDIIKISQSLPTAPFIYSSIQVDTPPSDTSKQKAQSRPSIAPKPQFKPDSHQTSVSAPSLPVRQKSSYREAKKVACDDSQHYSNVLPISAVSPTIKVKRSQTTHEQTRMVNPSSMVERKSHAISKAISCSKDVAELSVENVCEYLKELNLSQYVDSFKEHMIDGAMLVELEPDLLREEIGMKRIEAIRLMKFAKEGRLPVRD
ncbi:uncharacterized protein LOC123540306 isoform X2 [Mercenaria mercenaria]|nr:uncharacterized protein LOC123540306 isoform X2 [Mercenaria mercenaria]